MVGTTAALLGSAAISAGGSLLGGLFGKSAAQKAAELQAKQADAAGQKVEGAVRDVNPQIINGAANASDMALRAGGEVIDTASAAGRGVVDAGTQANALLKPYSDTGETATTELNKGLVDGGTFNKTPTMADIQIDPGFAFRIKQAQIALDRSSAAKGGNVSGAALKEINDYTQNSAQQEYANAFNRYRTTTQDRFGNLVTAANMGKDAASTEGMNLLGAKKYEGDINTDAAKVNLGANEYAGSETYDAAKTTARNTIEGAEKAGEYLTQKGNAQASGVVGGYNALAGGISGAGSGVSNAVMLNALLQNPATATPSTPPGFVKYADANPFNRYANVGGSNIPAGGGIR